MNRPRVLWADTNAQKYLHQLSIFYTAFSPVRLTMVYTVDALVQQLKTDRYNLVIVSSTLPIAAPRAHPEYLSSSVKPAYRIAFLLEGFLRPKVSALTLPRCKTRVRKPESFLVFTSTRSRVQHKLLTKLHVASVDVRAKNLFDVFVYEVQARLHVTIPK